MPWGVWFCENNRYNGLGLWTFSKIVADYRSTLLSMFVISLLACFPLCFPLNTNRRFTFKAFLLEAGVEVQELTLLAVASLISQMRWLTVVCDVLGYIVGRTKTLCFV